MELYLNVLGVSLQVSLWRGHNGDAYAGEDAEWCEPDDLTLATSETEVNTCPWVIVDEDY